MPDDQPSADGPGPARSGNVFGADAHALAAELATKITVSAAAAAPPPAHGNGHRQQLPGGGQPQGAGPAPGAGLPGSSPSTAADAGATCHPVHRLTPSEPQGSPGTPPPLALRELLLPDAGLRSVPPEVWAALPSVSKLDLSGNALPDAPALVGALVGAAASGLASGSPLPLQVLLMARLPGLTLWPLPGAPGSLPALRQLSLAGCNRLATPPHPAEAAFASCASALVTLNLSGAAWPDELIAAGNVDPETLTVLYCRPMLVRSCTHVSRLALRVPVSASPASTRVARSAAHGARFCI
jgi:hypothetical protein